MNANDYIAHARYWIGQHEPQRALTCLDEAAQRLGEQTRDVADLYEQQRIGVIVGIQRDVPDEAFEHIDAQLSKLFPGVTFAVLPHSQSIWFPLPSESNHADDANAQQ